MLMNTISSELTCINRIRFIVNSVRFIFAYCERVRFEQINGFKSMWTVNADPVSRIRWVYVPHHILCICICIQFNSITLVLFLIYVTCYWTELEQQKMINQSSLFLFLSFPLCGILFLFSVYKCVY